MCDPVSAGIATAVGAAASLAGTFMASNAAKQNQAAINAQNQATMKAQNEGFTQRLNAGLTQTAAQAAASEATLRDRGTAADTMRTQQMSSLQDYQKMIEAQNTQSEALRQTGDTQAQQLLQQTTAQNLDDAQTRRQQEAAALLSSHGETGPGPTDPDNSVRRDPVAGGALARRTAEAATNIRNYGSKIGALTAYDAPNQAVNLAVAENKFGIMPAQTAEKLLDAGSATRLLPSKVAYGAATGLGNAQDTLIASRGQNALDAAGLSYGNATDIANLGQSNATTIAANTARQAQANAEYAKSQAGIISGLGNLSLYGAGYYGGDSLKKAGQSVGSLFGIS